MKELQVLTNAIDMAMKAGVYSLQDAGQILQCINNLSAFLNKGNTPIENKQPTEATKEVEPKPKRGPRKA